MRGKNCAWIVTVPSDDQIQNAVLSGRMLRESSTSGSVLALVSTSVSTTNISKLSPTFDFVILANGILEKSKAFGLSKKDACLLETLNLTTFSKLVVVNSGILAFRQADELFDTDGFLVDKDGSWAVASIQPDADLYAKVTQQVLKNTPFTFDHFKELVLTKNNAKEFRSVLSGCVMSTLDLDSHVGDKDDTIFIQLDPKWTQHLTPNSKVNGNHINGLQNGLDHDKGFWSEFLETKICSILNNQNESAKILLEPTVPQNRQDTQNWIAIVGMSCRLPSANSVEEYWDILKHGRNTCSTIPEHRLAFSDIEKDVKANFLKCKIDDFDASFFGISPSEATFTDPQTRLSLEVSWEAFEDAGINPEKLRNTTTGIFYGSWLQEYKEMGNVETPPSEDFLRKYLGNGFGCSAAKLSYFYGFTGPNVATENGCSSSIMAVDLACKSLKNGECQVALAAGSNVILQINLKKKVVWAEDGICRTFDANANGYARAEGVAVLVLKRYSDAIRDNDRIHGIIRGSGVSQEGLSRSFGTPTVESETTAMMDALKAAKVSPTEVDYVEAHATGTGVGDPIESTAIVHAYTSPEVRKNPLLIGSGKTNIGHTESCSGIAGIIKVLLAMKHELIPAHLHLQTLNPKVNFESIPGTIPIQPAIWPRNRDKPRIAGISSFGITGTDVHMIIQEPPTADKIGIHSAPGITLEPEYHLVSFSAKSEEALEELTEGYFNHLENSSTINLADFAYTVNSGRAHHLFRKSVVATTKDNLMEQLYTKKGYSRKSRADKPKVCFTFPGLVGTMDLEPAKILYASSTVFKMNMDHCNKVLQKVTGMSISNCISLDAKPENQKLEEWYACMLAVQYSLVKTWESWGIKPDVVMGHCLGEVIAAVVSGALSLEDGFRIITAVKIFMEIKGEQRGSMMAINSDNSRVEEMIATFTKSGGGKTTQNWLEVAVINSSTQVVVAGLKNTLEHFKEFCVSQGFKCKIMPVHFAIHSQAIQPALVKCEGISSKLHHAPCKIPYISSVTGALIQPKDLTNEYWHKCFRNQVQFTAASSAAYNLGCDVYLEMGLGAALTNLTQENLASVANPPLCVPSFVSKGDKCWFGLLNSLGQLYTMGMEVDWQKFYQFHQRNKLSLPHYPFQRKSFWFERRTAEEKNAWVVNTSVQLHPLVGSTVSTALDQRIFQNSMSRKKAEYVFDHVIGSEVIFPAAGFMEMILASGNFDADSKVVISCVEDFNVHLPLHLESSVPKQMQTLLVDDNTDEGILRASVHAQDSLSLDKNNWKLQASGVLTFPPNNAESHEVFTPINLNELMERCPLVAQAAETFYSQAATAGLNFGPEFQSMKTIYRNGTETLVQVNIPSDAGQYVCHPLLTDAMLQCFIFHSKPEFKKLHVPIRIGKFTCRPATNSGSNESPTVGYIYCKSEASGLTKSVYLMDYDGNVIGVMTNPELAATTVESVLAAAGANRQAGKDIPDIFEVFWKQSNNNQLGNSLKESADDLLSTPGFQVVAKDLEQRNNFTQEEQSLDDNINRLCYLYVLKSLFDFGWKPQINERYDVNGLISQFNVVPELAPAFRHFFSYLQENGVVQRVSGSTLEYVVKYAILDEYKILDEISRVSQVLADYPPLDIIQVCGSQLAEILQGHITGPYILFGTERNGENLAELYYRTTRLNYGMFQAPGKVFNEISKQMWTDGKGRQGDTLRILEVGAGTGTFTKEVLPLLHERGINHEYYFTDISPSFFSRALAKFDDYKSSLICKTLDVEKDPLKQGFPPGYFDIIVGVDVFHATRVLNTTVKNLQVLTRKGGMVIIGETDIPTKELDIVFGILDGYWLFDDDIRTTHCVVKTDKWVNLLKQHGFTESIGEMFATQNQMSVITAKLTHEYNHEENTTVAGSVGTNHWVVFHDSDVSPLVAQMGSYGREVTTLSLKELATEVSNCGAQSVINQVLEERKTNLEGIIYFVQGPNSFVEPDSRLLLEPLLSISKFFLQSKMKVLPKLHVATMGAWFSGDENGIHQSGPSTAPFWGYMRTVRIEVPGLISKCVDLDPSSDSATNIKNLFFEMWIDDKETEVIYRDDTRQVRRLKNGEISQDNALTIPLTTENRYTIQLPESKLLSDLKFVPKAENKLGANQVEVEVRVASLNFKDVLTVMKPSKEFENYTIIGLDYSGVITSVGANATKQWKVGDAVFGCNWTEGTITSHLVSDADFIMPVPSEVTFCEAATLPAVFLTAWYCMVNIAHLQRGQTVLVHAASGGVGLIAIQVAKILGVNVIGTAGNPKKRNFLRSLGVEHVFSSRNLEYEEKIKQITKGKGIDMILNCLTGPGFKEASLEVLKEGGHFVEISKLDIWQPDEVRRRKPSVHYNIVDLMVVEPLILQEVMSQLTKYLKSGQITPLTFKRYSALNIVDALTFLQKAKQIGKVLVEMPRYVSELDQFKEYLFNDRSTYLITGGKGAIGIAVAKWMVSQGAKYLVLAGRSPPNDATLAIIHEMENNGAQIICAEADISDFNQSKQLIDNIKGTKYGALPPIRGIHHCSGVLSDRLISSQDWDNFEYVLAPKIKGAYNLHTLTLDCPLEFFVMYSSMATAFGNIGQSNYSAANAYMDSLVEMRQAMGLKGLTVNWGQWKAGLAENLELDWVHPFSIEQGINALHQLFTLNKVSAVVGNIKLSGVIRMSPNYEKTLFESLQVVEAGASKQAGKGKANDNTGKPTLMESYTTAGDLEEKTRVVSEFVLATVCDTLGLKESEVDVDLNFADMGMDSLMSIEFTNKVQSDLGDTQLGFVDIEEYGTVTKMTELIVSIITSSST